MAYNNNIMENIEVVKDLMLTDMQKRLFNDYTAMRKNNPQVTDEDYDRALSVLVSDISIIKTMKGVNDVLCHYSDLFNAYDELLVPTIDGTTNYVIDLLVKQCKLNKQSV